MQVKDICLMHSSDVLCYLQEFMHHVGLYMAKERGAKIANEVLFGAAGKV